jgi:Carbohydrate esterase 2 N-terminal/GDSL-like Lipase/Acylhydrolase family
MNRRIQILCLLSIFASSTLCPAQSGQSIPASDSRFGYEGRFDKSDPAHPVAIWESSRVSLDFDGPSLRLLFSGLHGQCFFNATVDGATQVIALRQGEAPINDTFSNLGEGRHHLTLFKRSEAAAGTVSFDGVELAAGAKAYAPAAPAYKTSLLFIGDSISVGACAEDGPTDQWLDRGTHNSAKSYTTLTAAAFDADHQNISVSGIGIVTGYFPFPAGRIWNRLYATPTSAKADLAQWTPRYVLVNLGDNDDSYPRSQKKPFPANFTDAYIAFIDDLRAAYPSAQIILLQGGMWNGANSPALLGAWYTAVARLESSDKKIAHYAFHHWTFQHPRVADHQALADELITWLKQQDFMTK